MAELALAMLLTALPAPGLADLPKNCTAATRAANPPKLAPRKLGDEPPASQIYAVDNRVAGCPEPVVVRKGIGQGTSKPMPDVRTVPRMHRLR